MLIIEAFLELILCDLHGLAIILYWKHISTYLSVQEMVDLPYLNQHLRSILFKYNILKCS